MSERLTNVEVEDVLASIRRLVLDGAGGVPVAGVPRPAVEPGGGRLVLTPALRVAPPEAPSPEPPSDAPVPFRHRAAPPEAPPAVASDPDALRRLVAEVLREELAGELGERITRNVRTLVEREIARALSRALGRRPSPEDVPDDPA